MKRYILDTSAYSHMVRGHKEVAALVQNSDSLALSLVTVAELKYGFAHGNRQLENQKLLERFLASSKVRLLIPDQLTIEDFVSIGTNARKQGAELAHHDLWLAAQAVQHDFVLVSFDKDFTYLQQEGFNLKFLK